MLKMKTKSYPRFAKLLYWNFFTRTLIVSDSAKDYSLDNQPNFCEKKIENRNAKVKGSTHRYLLKMVLPFFPLPLSNLKCKLNSLSASMQGYAQC